MGSQANQQSDFNPCEACFELLPLIPGSLTAPTAAACRHGPVWRAGLWDNHTHDGIKGAGMFLRPC